MTAADVFYVVQTVAILSLSAVALVCLGRLIWVTTRR